MSLDDELLRAGSRLNAELEQVPVPQPPHATGRLKVFALVAVVTVALVGSVLWISRMDEPAPATRGTNPTTTTTTTSTTTTVNTASVPVPAGPASGECDATTVAGAAERLLSDLTSDPAAADSQIAENGFLFFSITGDSQPRIQPESFDRSSLAAYLKDRANLNESFVLRSLIVSTSSIADELAATMNFTVYTDGGSTEVATADGGFSCSQRLWTSWGMVNNGPAPSGYEDTIDEWSHRCPDVLGPAELIEGYPFALCVLTDQ